MIRRSKRLVLFLPHRANPEEGVRVCADLLPLEMLQIATFPHQEGYEIHIVDAMVHPDYMRRLMELCDGALCFASSCILGYQVAHGAEVAKAVRERFPDLPIIWGGWFPSCLPDQYFAEGIADAVAIGQGELTFWDVVQALENGEPLDGVAGLAIFRDGKTRYTAQRPVVGFDQIPKVPWELIDFELYADLQANPGKMKLRHKLPDPVWWEPGTKARGFSYFSSYGCPEPCTFCCSPIITNRRWKAIPGKALAEDLLELHGRYKFNVMRFQDANFGVAEKRSNEFCETLIEHGAPFAWNGTYEIETLSRYKESSIDLMKESGCHLAIMGAEAGTEEQQARIKKEIDLEQHLTVALDRIFERGIQTGCTWIIGYPGETLESMYGTLRRAADMKYRYPGSASDIFPFRAIPGSEDYDRALELGYKPPVSLESWGSHLEYKLEIDDVGLPEDVLQTWKRYVATASIYDGHTKEAGQLMRPLLQKMAGWRLKRSNYSMPVEQKLFSWWVKVSGQSQQDLIQMDRTSGVTPSAPTAN
jgi:radical SAM superfamily enzyme YgiQ (UPF0313 family)